MKRLLLVDDERPFVESLALLVKRELSEEFEIVGMAFTGREAVEKAQALSPDVIVMDLRMPGLSGLDAIREMRSRGSSPQFILITAYERFDTALEAVTLGVADYLLKPVSKDRFFHSLRAAAIAIDKRNELERRLIEQREREEGLRDLVEASFLQAIMLGERSSREIGAYFSALGLGEGRALVGAAAFLSPPSVIDAEGDERSSYEAFCRTIRYKSRALVGPLVAGHCAIFLPLANGDDPAEAESSIIAALESAHGSDIARGRARLSFAQPVPVADAASAWADALRSLAGSRLPASGSHSPFAPSPGADPLAPEEAAFEAEDSFLEAVAELSIDRASLALEQFLLPLAATRPLPERLRFRTVALLGAAYRTLAGMGALEPAEAAGLFNFGDILGEEDGQALCLAARARFSKISASIAAKPRCSDPVQGAIAYIEANFDKPITLESTADALAVSPKRLTRLLFAEVSKGFSELLIEFRIGKAKELLSRPGALIKQVGSACGYPDQNYFSRLFKKRTGLTPSLFAIEAAREKE